MRILFLHSTMIGSLCATGQLLSKLVDGLPNINIDWFEVCLDIDSVGLSQFQYDLNSFLLADSHEELCKRMTSLLSWSKPDIVIFRPDTRLSLLIEPLLLMKSNHDFRLITSFMDTWTSDKDHVLLSLLIAETDVFWFISEQIRFYFSSRFSCSGPQYVIANGVEDKWYRFPDIRLKPRSARLICRFFGSINNEQTYEGLSLLCSAVKAKSSKVSLEIYSRQYKTKLAKSLVKCNEVTLHPPLKLDDSYFSRLNSADIIFIPYGWSAKCVAYLQHSFGNKIPECLATGKPIVATGHRDLNSLRFLQGYPGVFVVSDDNTSEAFHSIELILDQIVNQYPAILRESQERRLDVISQFNLAMQQHRFVEMLNHTVLN